MDRRGLIACIVVLCLGFGACRKKPSATRPVPTPAAVPTRSTVEAFPEPPSTRIPPAQPSPGPPVENAPGEIPPPPPPKARVKRSRPAAAPAPAPVVEAPPPTPPTNLPQLGQMLSGAERERYSREVDSDLRSARTNLATAAKRGLNPSQQSAFQQIDSFIRQSEELRKTDLVAAKGLSAKAAVLARELAAGTGR